MDTIIGQHRCFTNSAGDSILLLDRSLDFQARRCAIHLFKEETPNHRAVICSDGILSRANQRGLLDY